MGNITLLTNIVDMIFTISYKVIHRRERAVIMEKTQLIEEREQLKLLLTQEEFYYDHLPQRRQMAIIGIVLDALVTIAILWLSLAIAGGAFGLVVGPICLVLWGIWVLATWKRIGPDVKLLKKEVFHTETVKSKNKQEKLRKQIEELQKQIDEIPVMKWMP